MVRVIVKECINVPLTVSRQSFVSGHWTAEIKKKLFGKRVNITEVIKLKKHMQVYYIYILSVG